MPHDPRNIIQAVSLAEVAGEACFERFAWSYFVDFGTGILGSSTYFLYFLLMQTTVKKRKARSNVARDVYTELEWKH